MAVIFSALVLLLLVGALIDIITRDTTQVRYMPKIVWVLLVILLPLIGSVLWFTLGRERPTPADDSPRVYRASRVSWSGPVAESVPPTKSTEEQLADVEREIEFYKKQAELRELKRRAELEGPE